MTTANSWVSTQKAIAGQQPQLDALLVALRSRFHTRAPVSRSLISLLNALADHLRLHFELEEDEDYLPSLARQMPRLASQIDQLLGEHDVLLRDVDELVDDARAAFSKRQGSDELAEKYQVFRSKLSEHEALEKQVLQEAYCVDIGTKD